LPTTTRRCSCSRPLPRTRASSGQAAGLWPVKHRLWQHLLTQIRFDPRVCLVDSVPIPICRFARAYRCWWLRELAAWDHDETAKTCLGLRAQLRVCWPGVIVDGRLTPANLADQAVAAELLAWDGSGSSRSAWRGDRSGSRWTRRERRSPATSTATIAGRTRGWPTAPRPK
jgi:hypothetical protein